MFCKLWQALFGLHEMLESEGKPIQALTEVLWEEDDLEEKIIFTRAYIFLPIAIIFSIFLTKFPKLPALTDNKYMHGKIMYRLYSGSLNITNPTIFPQINDDLIVASENVSRSITANFSSWNLPSCLGCKEYNVNMSDIIETAKKDENREIIQIQNVFIDREGSIIANNSVYKQDNNTLFNNKNVYYYNEYDSIIAITNGRGVNENDFWILNILPLIAIMPKALIKKSMILISDASNFMIDAIDFLNISNAKIISLDQNELFYAHNVFTFSNVPNRRIDPSTLLTFRERVVKILRLDKHYPTRNIIYLKWKNDEKIRNAYELTILRMKYGMWGWETFESCPRFADNAKRFNKVNAIIIPTGTALASTIWMQKGTTIIELHHARGSPSFDYAYYSAILKHKHIIYGNTARAWRDAQFGLFNWDAFNELTDLVY